MQSKSARMFRCMLALVMHFLLVMSEPMDNPDDFSNVGSGYVEDLEDSVIEAGDKLFEDRWKGKGWMWGSYFFLPAQYYDKTFLPNLFYQTWKNCRLHESDQCEQILEDTKCRGDIDESSLRWYVKNDDPDLMLFRYICKRMDDKPFSRVLEIEKIAFRKHKDGEQHYGTEIRDRSYILQDFGIKRAEYSEVSQDKEEEYQTALNLLNAVKSQIKDQRWSTVQNPSANVENFYYYVRNFGLDFEFCPDPVLIAPAPYYLETKVENQLLYYKLNIGCNLSKAIYPSHRTIIEIELGIPSKTFTNLSEWNGKLPALVVLEPVKLVTQFSLPEEWSNYFHLPSKYFDLNHQLRDLSERCRKNNILEEGEARTACEELGSCDVDLISWYVYAGNPQQYLLSYDCKKEVNGAVGYIIVDIKKFTEKSILVSTDKLQGFGITGAGYKNPGNKGAVGFKGGNDYEDEYEAVDDEIRKKYQTALLTAVKSQLEEEKNLDDVEFCPNPGLANWNDMKKKKTVENEFYHIQMAISCYSSEIQYPTHRIEIALRTTLGQWDKKEATLAVLERCPPLRYSFDDGKDGDCRPYSVTAKSGNVTTAKPGNVTTAKPGRVTIAKPGKMTTVKPGNVMTAKQDNVTIAKPKNVITAKPDNVTTAKPVNVTIAKPVNVTIAKPDIVMTAKPGNVTTAKPDNVTIAKPGNVTIAKPGNVTTAKPGNVTTAKPVNVTIAKPDNVMTVKLGNVTTAKLGNVTTAKPDNVMTAKPGNVTTAKPDNVKTAKPGNVTTAKPDNVTIAKPHNATIAKPDNVTIAKPDNVTVKTGEAIQGQEKDTEEPDEVTKEPDSGTEKSNQQTLWKILVAIALAILFILLCACAVYFYMKYKPKCVSLKVQETFNIKYKPCKICG